MNSLERPSFESEEGAAENTENVGEVSHTDGASAESKLDVDSQETQEQAGMSSAEKSREDDRKTMDPEQFWYKHGVSYIDAEQAKSMLRFPDFVASVAKGIGGDPYRKLYKMSDADQAEIARLILENKSNDARLVEDLDEDLLQAFVVAAKLPMKSTLAILGRLADRTESNQ